MAVRLFEPVGRRGNAIELASRSGDGWGDPISDSKNRSLVPPETWQWLATQTGFPARRLESRAELLILLAAAARQAELSTGSTESRLVRQDGRQFASQRQQAENRKKAHFKSNNRTKV